MKFLSRKTRRDARVRSVRRTSPLRLEQLEARLVLSTFTVINTNDSGTGSLRQAILDTNADLGGDIIQFASGVTGTITLTSGELDITDAVDLQGPGSGVVTVSGNNASLVFGVSANATISDLTIDDGSSDYGGGIANLGGTLAVSHSTFSGNSGGGIYNTGSLTVSDSTFAGNIGESFTNPLATPSGADPETATYTIPVGSGIDNRYGGMATVSGSTFADNTGSGIFNYYDPTVSTTIPKVIVSDSTFSGNQAGFGGGIYSFGGMAQVNNSTFFNNSASGQAYSAGGGINSFNGGTLTVSNSTFSDNQAGYNTAGTYVSGSGGYGGGICVSYGAAATVSNSTFSGNRSHDYGGGIFNYLSTLTVTDSTLSGNSAVSSAGGGIWSGGYWATVGNTIIAGNTAPAGPDFAGGVTSNGYNLIGNTSGSSGFGAMDLVGLSPMLAPLGDNGGPTQTMALLPGSPAIDAGSNALAVDPVTNQPLTYDQRGAGFLRVLGSAVDIGAHESPAPLTATNLQAAISSLPQNVAVIVQATTNTAVSAAVQAVNGVTNPTPATPVTVTLDLGGSTLTTDTHVNAGPGVNLVITDGTLVGGSPALIVDSGNVRLDHVTALNATNAPTIVLNGGTLTVRNSTIQESTGYAQTAILITGGTADLGTAADPGGNTINVNGDGEMVRNTTSGTVPDTGNTLEVNGSRLPSSDLSFTALGSSNVSTVYGQTVTLNAAVRSANPSDGTPTGTVDFIDTTTGVDLGTAPVSMGVAQLTTAALAAGTNAITAHYLGDGSFAFSLDTLTRTVTPAPLALTDNQAKLYGAAVALSPTYSGFVLGQNATTAGITGAPTLTTTAAAANLIGSYPITVGVSTLSAANYSFTAANGTLTVNPQTALSATYTGLLYVATASSTTSTATVTLSATITDTSGGAGDVRNATVTFVNRVNGSIIAGNLPVSLVNSTNIKTGTASYNWSLNIGSANSQSYTIGIIVGNDYTRNSSSDDAVVTVSEPQAGSATGGGYLVNMSSTGIVPGDPGANTNFGFEAKNNSKGLQGQTNIVVRYQGHAYQFNASAITSLTFPSGNTADYAGTGTIQDVTNSSNPVTLYTGASSQVTMTDNGEPGTNDTIGITIRTPAGALWFSSAWNGTTTVEQNLGNGHGGGNLQVRPAQELAGEPAGGTTAVAPLTLDEIKPIAAAAIARWAAAGIDPQRLSILNHAVFQVDDLTGSDLGWARQGVITLDRTADGYGWFIDPTPGDNSEFGPGAANSPASGHVDLLSVVAHEMGHLLGFGEDAGNGVTGEYLAPSVRHVPVAIHPPLSPAATASDSASVNTATAGPQRGVHLASPLVGRSPAAISQAVVISGSKGTTDGLMALDAALADWSATSGQEIPRNRRFLRMEGHVAERVT